MMKQLKCKACEEWFLARKYKIGEPKFCQQRCYIMWLRARPKVTPKPEPKAVDVGVYEDEVCSLRMFYFMVATLLLVCAFVYVWGGQTVGKFPG